jgi:hypothetical protein
LAIYDLKCVTCDEVLENHIMPITHTKEDIPLHCGKTMGYFITKAPMGFVTDTEFPVPFKAGAEGTIISNKRQKKEFMAKHDLYDANEVMTPPSPHEVAQTREEIRKSIEAITPTAQQKEQLKSVGLDDIVK